MLEFVRELTTFLGTVTLRILCDKIHIYAGTRGPKASEPPN